MKKIIAYLTLAFITLLPLSSVNAQSVEGSVWDALDKMAALENTKSLESIYGSFDIDEPDTQLKVNYRINMNNMIHNAQNMTNSSEITAQLSVVNGGEVREDGVNFKSFVVNLNGQLISANEKDLYVKLNDISFDSSGADENWLTEIEQAKTMLNLVKGNWYHLPLEEFYQEGFRGMAYEPLLKNFKEDPKKGFREMIEKMAIEHVKQEQYYTAMIGDYTLTEPLKALDLPNQDYHTYLTDEVKQNPTDLPGLVSKGVIECEGDTYLGKDLANGYQYPDCWPSITYKNPLTSDEEKLMEELYGNTGEWIFENNKWYYVNLSGEEASTTDEESPYKDVVTPEDFKYDQKAIDEKASKIMKVVDSALNKSFFNQREIINGSNQGFQFYNLNRSEVLDTIKDFALLGGDEVEADDEAQIRNTLGKMSLSGLYRIREENGVIDNFFARFKYNDEDFLKNFELNYRFKMTDWEKVNNIQIPTKVTELDNLNELMF